MPEIARRYMSELILTNKIDIHKMYALLNNTDHWFKWTKSKSIDKKKILLYIQAFGHYVIYDYVKLYGQNEK